MDPATAKLAVQVGTTLARSRAARYLVVGLAITGLMAGASTTFGPWMMTTQLAASMTGQQRSQTTNGDTCPTGTGSDSADTSSSAFTAEQVANAKTIWTVAQQMHLGRQGAIVGIAVALQESSLRNLPNGDRDSIGLFQQRAGWGSRTERMDPETSSRLFFEALKKVKGWRQMPVSEAAQAVQRSAFPSAYSEREKAAVGLVALIQSHAKPGSADAKVAIGSAMCGPADAAACPSTRLPVENGLTPDALRVLRCLKQRWPKLRSFGGIGDRPATVDRDHQEGRAIDVMVPSYQATGGRQLGEQIAAWVVANHERLGVKYVIWNARIWNVERADEGWRACNGDHASCYYGPNDTLAHRDHVHVSVFGDQAGRPHTTGPIVPPMEHYVLTARFGECSKHWANCHTGLDFAAPSGTPIRALLSGTVIWRGWGGAYGNLTKIQCQDGVQTWYAHQSAIDVKAGETVTAGQTIGQVGATGNTTGPHVHLEVRVNGVPVDPTQWLKARGVTP